jgi:glycerol kinase
VRPIDIETTALGAAYAAGLAVGFWTGDEIFASEEKLKSATIFRSTLKEELRKKKVESWCKAVSRSFDLAGLSLGYTHVNPVPLSLFYFPISFRLELWNV